MVLQARGGRSIVTYHTKHDADSYRADGDLVGGQLNIQGASVSYIHTSVVGKNESGSCL